MKRLVSICDWLPPDFGAVGQYAEIEARRLAAEGADVALVGLSSSADEAKDEKTGQGTLRTVRVLARPYERAHFRQRALWTAATNGRLLRRAWKYAKAADEVLFTGSPPFFLHWIVPANLLLRKKLTYRITDFHPECLIAELGQRPLWLQFFLYWTLFFRRRVHKFEVLGEDQKRRLLEIGIPEDRITLRRDEAPVEITSETEPLELPEPLRGKVVLLYSGNFGVAHDDATFVEGYARFEVADEGEGIAPEHAVLVFDRLYRVPGAPPGGVGLGLAIARELVVAHGGRIGVDSGARTGSRFWFTVPWDGSVGDQSP